MTFEFLETPRLLLRRFSPEEYTYVMKQYSSDAIQDFFGITSTEELTRVQDRFSGGITSYEKSFLYFHLLEKQERKVIGWCGFHTWFLKHFRAEIGYEITNAAFRGKGLMQEAMGTVLHFGFNSMHLKRVEAFAGKDNIASLRLLENNRFTQEGLLREHYLHAGVLEDSLVFGLLKKDFEKHTGI